MQITVLLQQVMGPDRISVVKVLVSQNTSKNNKNLGAGHIKVVRPNLTNTCLEI